MGHIGQETGFHFVERAQLAIELFQFLIAFCQVLAGRFQIRHRVLEPLLRGSEGFVTFPQGSLGSSACTDVPEREDSSLPGFTGHHQRRASYLKAARGRGREIQDHACVRIVRMRGGQVPEGFSGCAASHELFQKAVLRPGENLSSGHPQKGLKAPVHQDGDPVPPGRFLD